MNTIELQNAFNALVSYEEDKIATSEAIKAIKDKMKDAGLEKDEIQAIAKIAAAKAKENTEGLTLQASLIQKYLKEVN
jgi:di/tripeptidase